MNSLFRILAIVFGIIFSSLAIAVGTNTDNSVNPFLGTWKLVSVTRDTVPPSKAINSFGEQPSGFLNYADDGRMMVIIVQKERPTPKDKIANDEEAIALYRTFNSYAGTYTIKDDHIVHHIDISWNQKWTGTNQIRYYQFVDNHLILSLSPTTVDDQVVVDSLVWEKISPSVDPEGLEQAVIEKLNKIKNEINTHGKAAVVDKLVKNNNEIFVLNYDGIFLSSPAHPEFIGTNQLNYQDPSGAFVVREEIEKAKAGGGWLKGRWRFNPDTQEYGCRKIYIMPMKDEYLIGSWYFYPFNTQISKAEQQVACGSTL